MDRILDWMENRPCPKCSGTEVQRSPRRGFLELILLSSISVRPFRCQQCANRFYRFGPNGTRSSSRVRAMRPKSGTILSVIVYGHGPDKESFQEPSDVRLVSMHRAELSLTTKVEPGQKLVLLDPTSDEEQNCRVISVSEQAGGQNIVSV